MLKKRLIFSLFTDGKYFYLSRNFRLQKVGDLKWLLNNYDFGNVTDNVDELIVYNIDRSKVISPSFLEMVAKLSKLAFIPLTVGGQIRSFTDVNLLVRAGADKISICSELKKNNNLIYQIRKVYGAQFICAKFDVKIVDGNYSCFIKNGQVESTNYIAEAINRYHEHDIGEIHINSIDLDGTGNGLDFDLLSCLPADLRVPVVLSGGIGKPEHILQGLSDERINGVSTGHLFNFVGNGLKIARQTLVNHKIQVANFG
jgi:cyclase